MSRAIKKAIGCSVTPVPYIAARTGGKIGCAHIQHACASQSIANPERGCRPGPGSKCYRESIGLTTIYVICDQTNRIEGGSIGDNNNRISIIAYSISIQQPMVNSSIGRCVN